MKQNLIPALICILYISTVACENICENMCKNTADTITITIDTVKKFLREDKLQEAIDLCKKAIEQDPNNALIYLLLGCAHAKRKAHQKAMKNYLAALKINKNLHAAWHNLALTLRKNELIDEAIYCYKKALELKPNDENYHFGLAQALLALGDWQEGWKEMDLGRISTLRCFKNRIEDPSQIAGKTIFIPKSWGLGDWIQFGPPYAKKLKEYGAKEIIIQVYKPLVKLLSSCKYFDKITADQRVTAHYDATVGLWSLPRVFSTTDTNMPLTPKDFPYLHADPSLVYKWGEKLKHDKNFKIGICWSGSGTLGEKDILLEKFAPIANIPGVTLYSLQKSRQCEQLQHVNFKVVDFGKELDENHGSFMDTAAIMKNLDLVITVDTSVAHLAGALNVPVWVFIIFGPDWRWLLDREDTPWYPSMRLFRAKKHNDWDNIINNMKTELKKVINNS